jgi:hypothetical protein
MKSFSSGLPCCSFQKKRGVVGLHETIHELHRKRKDGVILKLDFENAYDKVKWHFLQ